MSRESDSGLYGILNLNKQGGMTSRTVVDRVVKTVGKGVKVGHAGTLDPLATGILVVCVGPATRLIEYVQRQTKTYRTVVRLDAISDTLDADGNVTEIPGKADPGLDAIRGAMAAQVGTILQRPPEFSALKVAGKRAYSLARAGKLVVLAPRLVTIHSVQIVTYDWPRLTLEVVCGGGTYIRAIARDVGEALGCGGLVEVLERTRIGDFAIDDAIDPGTLTPETVRSLLRPALEAVTQLPSVRLSTEQVAEIAMGRAVVVSEPPQSGEIALLAPDGILIALGEMNAVSGKIEPRRVLIGVGHADASLKL